MNYFPHNPLKRSAATPAKAFAPVRQAKMRDILWNQPVFKAPVLAESFAPAQLDWGQAPGFAPRSNSAGSLDPLPLTATRSTERL